ncbi:MAG: DNA methyltransferase, partial [Clostridia bacterium]
FIAQLVWERAYAPKNDARFISNSHDYVLMYAKKIDGFSIGRLPRTDEANARYLNPDNDPRGVWKASDISVKTSHAACDYPITAPSGRIIEPPAGRCWSLSKSAFLERLHDNRIWFGPNGDGVPAMKRFLTELKFDGMAPTSILFYKDVGHSQEGAKEVTSLMEGGYFNGPKPTRLLSRLIILANTNKDCIILDFFSGSATTAHAVMKLNAEDG